MAATASQPAKPEVRNTRQRRVVKATLEQLEDFISAQDLHQLMSSRGESVSLATTYRILQSLAETQEVDVLKTADGQAIYRQCLVQQHHHHLLCRSCGAAKELEVPQLEQWAKDIGRNYGYQQVDHVIEITGICSSCQLKEDQGQTG